MRLFRSHAMTSSTWDRHRGHDPAYDVVDIGFNFRLDEPRAALGLSRLPRLAAGHRQRAARRVRAYRERLADVAGNRAAVRAIRPSSAPATSPSPCCCADRDDSRPLSRRPQAGGIQTTWYPALHTLHRLPALAPPTASQAPSEAS